MSDQKLMTKAERAAASAKLLLHAGDFEGACDRAYYAMFNAARAALIASGSQIQDDVARTHSGLISAFSLHLVKTGRIPVEYGRTLNKVEELRLIADYKGDPIDPEKAEWAVDQAHEFILAIRTLLLPD
ncbi:uncharacterized protein (UPF0332 family) [Oxalobacteraceae bacterium GrIS 2.11]